MKKSKFIIKEIKRGRLLYVLFSIFTYPLTKTKLKNWRLKKKDLILVKSLTNKIKQNYNLNFLNTYSKFYCEGLREIFDDRIYNFFQIKEGDIVYDVGAGGGEYSILCAKNGAKCVAFELRKEGYDLMNENIRLNNFQSEISTYLGKIDDKNTLDFYLKKTKKIPTIIKIDVEGDELKVMKKSKKIMRHSPKIILETHSKDLEKNCLGLLFKLNYKVKHKMNMGKNINLFFLEV